MTVCAVKGCQNENGLESENEDISFHKMPRDPDVREEWEQACNFPPGNYTKDKMICSLHFLPSDFRPRGQRSRRVLLKEEAVPSLFNFDESKTKPPDTIEDDPIVKNSAESLNIVRSVPDNTDSVASEIKTEVKDEVKEEVKEGIYEFEESDMTLIVSQKLLQGHDLNEDRLNGDHIDDDDNEQVDSDQVSDDNSSVVQEENDSTNDGHLNGDLVTGEPTKDTPINEDPMNGEKKKEPLKCKVF